MTVAEAIANLNQAVERYSGMHLSSEAFAMARVQYTLAVEALMKAVREEALEGFADKLKKHLQESK